MSDLDPVIDRTRALARGIPSTWTDGATAFLGGWYGALVFASLYPELAADLRDWYLGTQPDEPLKRHLLLQVAWVAEGPRA